MSKTFVTKLGTAKRVERSRIWIEGKRLIAASFTVGTLYHLITQGKRWTLHVIAPEDAGGSNPRRVSGKQDKPIIDITGQHVRDAFGHGTHVRVTYARGLITITPEA